MRGEIRAGQDTAGERAAMRAATTARYAHLSSDPVKAAADRIVGQIAAAMDGKSREVVTPL